MYNKRMKLSSLFSIITVLSGSALEYYDYMLFAFMLPVIGPIFNGPGDSLSVLQSSSFILFMGALMRPLGGLLIGYIGDKKGRNLALFWSMMIMAASSFLIAFLPSYAQIGAWAVFFLFLCRMAQTMSAAGELNGAAIYLIETLDTSEYKRSKKGLASGLAWSFTVLGMFGGTVASYHSSPDSWKWAFMLGGTIVLFAILLRMMPKANHGPAHSPKKTLENFKFMRSVTASILLAAGLSGMFYYNMIFLNLYWQIRIDNVIVREYYMYYFLAYAAALLVAGIISDYVKKKHVMMLVSCVLLAACGIPTLLNNSLHFHFINVILLALYVGPSHSILFDLFPREYRYRGVSTAYSIGTSLIGGATTYSCAKLAKYGADCGCAYYPAFWLMFVASLAFAGVYIGRHALVSSKN